MEQVWNRGGATVGKGSAHRTPENGLIKRQTVAAGCHRLPFGSHGKEGVDGSSPSEGSAKVPLTAFLVQIDLLVVECAVGMEPFMEPSGLEGQCNPAEIAHVPRTTLAQLARLQDL
jgi:hypothetical protein